MLKDYLDLAVGFIRSRIIRAQYRSWARSQFLDWREQRFRVLARTAYSNSSFYKELYDAAGVDVETSPIDSFPVVDKSMLMHNFDKVITQQDPALTRSSIEHFCANTEQNTQGAHYYLDRYFVIRSSGSTGVRGLFVFDRSYLRHMLAAVIAYSPFPPRQTWFRTLRIAGLFSTDRFHLGYSTFERLRIPGLRAEVIPASSDLEFIVGELNRFRPHIVAGYPSLLRELCESTMIDRIQFTPSRICCGGECLTHETRATISEGFRCPTYNFYGCAEANPIAIQLPDSTVMQVVEDFVMLEPVDSTLMATPPGELSHSCLLTNLHSTVMPLIRYRLEDQIVICPRGSQDDPSLFTVLSEVRGRPPYTVSLVGPRDERLSLHPSVFLRELDKHPNVRAAQLRQSHPNHLQVLIVPESTTLRDSDAEELKSRILSALQSRGITTTRFEFNIRYVSRIPPDPISGKVKAFVKERGSDEHT